MTAPHVPVRTFHQDPLFRTELVWRPHAYSNVRSPYRGALVGQLYGVEVNGKSTGRGVAYQIGMTTAEVRTVWWDGTVGRDGEVEYPYLYDVDTGEQVLRNPQYVAFFVRLKDIS